MCSTKATQKVCLLMRRRQWASRRCIKKSGSQSPPGVVARPCRTYPYCLRSRASQDRLWFCEPLSSAAWPPSPCGTVFHCPARIAALNAGEARQPFSAARGQGADAGPVRRLGALCRRAASTTPRQSPATSPARPAILASMPSASPTSVAMPTWPARQASRRASHSPPPRPARAPAASRASQTPALPCRHNQRPHSACLLAP